MKELIDVEGRDHDNFIAEDQFESWLLCVWSSSLVGCLGGQGTMASLLPPCSPSGRDAKTLLPVGFVLFHSLSVFPDLVLGAMES